MATLVLLELDVKPECVAEMCEYIAERFPETREFDGCNGITAYLDGSTMVFVEHWDSSEHYQKYYDWREETGVLARLVSYLASPPSIRHFEQVDA